MSKSLTGLTAATTPLAGTEEVYVVQGGNSRKASTGDFYIPGGTDVGVADGGTGASTAANARTNLGLAIGTNVQAYSTNLTTLAAVTPGATGLALLASATAAAAFSIVADTSAFNQALTGDFWVGLGSPRIHRMTDRVLVGGAVTNDGKLSNTVADWLTTAMQAGGRGAGFPTTSTSQQATLSTIGQIAVLGGSRASDFGGLSMGTIAGAFFAVNDQPSFNTTVYGLYAEAHRETTAPGNAHVYEGDVINKGTTVSINPYSMFNTGLTANLWVASGGGFTGATDASVAIGVVNNFAAYDKGIVFHATSLVGTSGTGTGTGTAIQMARGHKIEWAKQNGTAAADLVSDVTNTGPYQQVLFSDLGVLFRNNASKNLLRVDAADTFVNGFALFPKATGATPLFQALGDDTNVGLGIATQGTGVIDLFTNTSVRQLQIAHVATAVNYLKNAGAVTTAAPLVSVDGSDTNIGMGHATKGTGGFDFFTNTSVRQFQIAHVATAVNYLQAKGAATTGTPQLSALGSDTNVSLALATQGTGLFDFFTNGSVRQFRVYDTASAVNYIQLSGSATTVALQLAAAGADANVSMAIGAKAAGSVFINGNSAIAAEFQNLSSAAVNRFLIQGAVTTASPLIIANGSDTNITAILRGRGTGGFDLQDGGSVSKFKYNTTGVGFFNVTPAVQGAIALPTGTIQRTTYATSTVTLAQLAGVVMAMITDMRAYGLSG